MSETPPILEVVNLHKAFGPKAVLRGIDLTIETGLTTVIIGGSGSGKSVLLKHLIGLLEPDEGDVLFYGQAVRTMEAQELIKMRAKFGMLFQQGALFDSMSVLDNVAFPLREHRRGMAADEVRRLVTESLNTLDLYDVEHLFPAELSGGMKKRVGLARATILLPEIILYDEPTTGLDPIMITQVDDMIAATQRRLKVTSVVISHDMSSTFRIGQRIAMLHEGKIICYGTPDEVRRSEDPVVQRFITVSGTGPLQPLEAHP